MDKSTQVHKKKKVFTDGPIDPGFIGDSIAKHSSKTEVGSHSIFLGQVRADQHNDRLVAGIEYSAYTEMAEEKIQQIREDIFAQYQLTCIHIHHSLGRVEAGEICLFVFSSSPHRSDCIAATNLIVERIKKEVPIFGKEFFEDETHIWKVNRTV